MFNQNYFICDWWFNFDCAEAEALYSLNDDIAAERQANSPDAGAATEPQASYGAAPQQAAAQDYQYDDSYDYDQAAATEDAQATYQEVPQEIPDEQAPPAQGYAGPGQEQQAPLGQYEGERQGRNFRGSQRSGRNFRGNGRRNNGRRNNNRRRPSQRRGRQGRRFNG